MTQSDILAGLQNTQEAIHTLLENLRKLEAARDMLVRRLCDLEGASDSRPVAVR